MTIQPMDNVLSVVDDLEAARAFFAELGMELEGETQVEGPWVDRTVGLKGRPCVARFDALEQEAAGARRAAPCGRSRRREMS